jgi:hypothetical protein
MTTLYGALIGVAAWILWSIQYQKQMFPDSYQYVAMARGQRVPTPFWGRWLAPAILRERGYLWEAMTFVCVVAMHAGLAHAYGVWAAWLLLPSHLIAWNVRCPIGTDLIPLALLCWSITVKDPVALVVLGLLAGAGKQHAPMFMALAAWSPWPLVGLLGQLPGLLWYRKYDSEADKNPWLQSPLLTTLAAKRGHWMNPRVMLWPWGAVLPLALVTWDVRLLTALALAYAPVFVASDNARIYLWAFPIAVGYALNAPIDPIWWPVIVLANLIVSVYASEVRTYTKGGLTLV